MQQQARNTTRDRSLAGASRGHEHDRELIDAARSDPALDEDDAETELLRELAREVDRARSTGAAPARVTGERPAEVDPRMQVFLDGPPQPAMRRSAQLRVPHVEIDDLVEELATTAAALRARRAA